MRPRPYLSYRQLKMWEQSPDTYMATYFLGKTFAINRGMALGKKVADSLETGELTGDFEIDLATAQVPQYEIRDKEIIVELVHQKQIVPVLIKVDSLKEDYSALHEYKTGEIPWTQRKVDNDEQITFYATGVWIKKKKIPECELIWLPTEKRIDDDGVERLHLTGEMHRFVTPRNMTHVLNMLVRMRKAWKEIGERCDAELI